MYWCYNISVSKEICMWCVFVNEFEVVGWLATQNNTFYNFFVFCNLLKKMRSTQTVEILGFSTSERLPWTKAFPPPCPPLQWLTGGLVVVLVFWRRRWMRRGRSAGECEVSPLWPFTDLDLGNIVRSEGVEGCLGGLGMWPGQIYIWSLDIDLGSASSCCAWEALQTHRAERGINQDY